MATPKSKLHFEQISIDTARKQVEEYTRATLLKDEAAEKLLPRDERLAVRQARRNSR
jgi:hypothetical protein